METEERKILLPYMNPEQVAKEIGDFIVARAFRPGCTGGILGLSGGVDSTVTAALAKRAFDRHNQSNSDRQLELVGYILPSSLNDKKDEEDGEDVANRLGIRYETHSIEAIANAYLTTNQEALESNYDKGNLLSRIRANVLSTKSATERKTLIGTGNKDEDIGIGYYTLFGDGAVHLSPIAGLSKRLVCEMACYLGFEDLAERVPTAGLEPGQTDFGDLGYDYHVAELVTEGFAQGFTPEQLVGHHQVVPLVEKNNAQYEQMFGNAKFTDVQGVVYDIARRHASAKRKATIVSPPIAELTLQYR